MSPRDPKRVKTDAALDIVSRAIFESEDSLRRAYIDAKPYPHGRLENMFQSGFLGAYSSSIRFYLSNLLQWIDYTLMATTRLQSK